MAEEKDKKKPTRPQADRAIARVFGGLVLLLLVAVLLSQCAKRNAAPEQSHWVKAAEIACTPNESVYDRSGGFCTSRPLPPGDYRIRITGADLALSEWRDGQIIGALRVPPGGRSLTEWSGQPFVAQFREQAVLPSLPKVGAPVARINHGVPFDPLSAGGFALDSGDRIGISMNVLAERNSFRGTQGALRAVIERRGEPPSS